MCSKEAQENPRQRPTQLRGIMQAFVKMVMRRRQPLRFGAPKSKPQTDEGQ
jgi:hypothetical protein